MKNIFVMLVSLLLITACDGGDVPAQNTEFDANIGQAWLTKKVDHLYTIKTSDGMSTYYELYKSKISGTCYLKVSEGNRMSFGVVPCRDWE